mmetsp:Transcript_1570/g.2815  ORF Transcript_1570/g.2815 Transcript_1570/m.2815 type:complete len:150 (+) Transcript_1570:493-942(+)
MSQQAVENDLDTGNILCYRKCLRPFASRAGLGVGYAGYMLLCSPCLEKNRKCGRMCKNHGHSKGCCADNAHEEIWLTREWICNRSSVGEILLRMHWRNERIESVRTATHLQYWRMTKFWSCWNESHRIAHASVEVNAIELSFVQIVRFY